jgi:hypothetical protein
MKTWSISTTVRNPERLRDFLGVAKRLEGEVFNRDNQVKFQTLLIQSRLYRPTNLTHEQDALLDNIDQEVPFNTAKEIFEAQNYQDPAMRGRTSISPLKKMGLCTTENELQITELGKYFLSSEYDLGNVFFIHFLKWQLPNPTRRDFFATHGFSIKPFIGTLHLIRAVNRKWTDLGNKPKGLSKEEFSLFVPTLIDYNKIEEQADRIIEYRNALAEKLTKEDKRQFSVDYKRQFAAALLDNPTPEKIKTFLSNLRDYGDNTIRYFRLTRFIYIRGGGYYIDLEPRRSIEIDLLLSGDNASPQEFTSAEQYIEYLADIKQPILPWETETELKRIAEGILIDISAYEKTLSERGIEYAGVSTINVDEADTGAMKEYVGKLRQYRLELQELETHFEAQKVEHIEEYIRSINGIFDLEGSRPIELERLATLALNSLNDAIRIKPNYPVGDDNQPTNTAPGGVADIECFYEGFNAICEVTMLTDRSQWYNEGQPVMRHLRDFEEKHPEKEAYCLFIAPRLHVDTLETFWTSNKYGYRGSAQRIIPMALTQFTLILETLRQLREENKLFTHSNLLSLYKKIRELTEETEDSARWVVEANDIISDWSSSLLSKA